jgi:hypothetical protein
MGTAFERSTGSVPAAGTGGLSKNTRAVEPTAPPTARTLTGPIRAMSGGSGGPRHVARLTFERALSILERVGMLPQPTTELLNMGVPALPSGSLRRHGGGTAMFQTTPPTWHLAGRITHPALGRFDCPLAGRHACVIWMRMTKRVCRRIACAPFPRQRQRWCVVVTIAPVSRGSMACSRDWSQVFHLKASQQAAGCGRSNPHRCVIAAPHPPGSAQLVTRILLA